MVLGSISRVWYGIASTTWYCIVICCVLWYGMVKVLYGINSYCVVWYCIALYCTLWYGVVWSGVALHGIVSYGGLSYCILLYCVL